jgi:phage gp45-like
MQFSKLFSFIAVALLVAVVFAGLVTISAEAQTAPPLAAKSAVATVNSSAGCMKHIIFLDEDIAPWSDLNTLKNVNQVFIDENVPTTLAIIPHPDTDSSLDNQNELYMDTSMLNYLLSIKTNPLFEFAQHGYNHATGSIDGNGSEYSGRPYKDQYNSIKQGWDDIAEALGVATTTFVPPWNDGDTNTVLAAHAVGHTLYLQGADFEIPWQDVNWDAPMSDLTTQTDAALNAAPCGADFVVLTHFWSYTQDTTSNTAIDWHKINLLETYIEHLKARGDVDFTTCDNPYALPESARTHITLTASNTNPGVGQSVTFTGNLGVAVAGKSIQIWHVEPNLYRSNDSTVTTDSNGNFSFTTSWSTTGKRPYSATFEGDSSYIQSLSFPVNITVRPGSVTLTATASTSTPSVNQNFTINGTLSASGTGIGGATITLQRSTDNAAWSNVTTNVTNATGGYLFSKNESSARTYYYRTAYDGNTMYSNATSNVANVTVLAGAWSTWGSLGGQLTLTSSPAAVSSTSGRIDLFARGINGSLYQKTYKNNGWSAWTSLGGHLATTTGPAVSSWSSTGRLDVFVVGTDYALWHRYYQNNVWSPWESLGGRLTASPAAVSWSNGRIDVFGRGGDGSLWHRFYDYNAWSAWEPLGGQLAPNDGPAVSSWAAGHLDVFVVGTNNALYQKSYQNGAWSIWTSLGGKLTSSPAAVSSGNGRIDVFGRGSDSALYQKTFQNGAWSGWTSLGGQLTLNTGPAVSSQATGQLDIFVIGSDQALWHRTYA